MQNNSVTVASVIVAVELPFRSIYYHVSDAVAAYLLTKVLLLNTRFHTLSTHYNYNFAKTLRMHTEDPLLVTSHHDHKREDSRNFHKTGSQRCHFLHTNLVPKGDKMMLATTRLATKKMSVAFVLGCPPGFFPHYVLPGKERAPPSLNHRTSDFKQTANLNFSFFFKRAHALLQT